MTARPLFLKWTLINVLSVLFTAGLYKAGFADGLKGAAAAATLVILAVTVCFSGYAGWLCWRADRAMSVFGPVRGADRILHDADHIHHSIWLCQILGVVGALLGYKQTARNGEGISDPGSAIHSVFLGLSNNLTPTTIGVLCSLLFFVEYRLLEHALRAE